MKLNRLELIRRPQTGQHLSSDLNKNNIYIITLTEGEGRGVCSLPVIIHVDVEVVQARQDCVTLDTVHRPQVVLDLVLVLAHGGVVVVVPAGLRLSRRQGGLGDHGGLGEVVQGQLGVLPLLLLGTEPGRQDGGHLRLLLLDKPAEREWQTEVREGCRVVESGVEGLELHGVSRLRPFALLGQVFSPAGNDGVSQLLRHHSSLLTIC